MHIPRESPQVHPNHRIPSAPGSFKAKVAGSRLYLFTTRTHAAMGGFTVVVASIVDCRGGPRMVHGLAIWHTRRS